MSGPDPRTRGEDAVNDAVTLIRALGGRDNIVDVEGCILRIRVQVRDQGVVDEPALRLPGVMAVVRSGDVVQIVAGTVSDEIAADMMRHMDVAHGTRDEPPPPTTVP